MKNKIELVYAENGWVITWIPTGKVYVCEKEEGENIFATSRLMQVLDQIAQKEITPLPPTNLS